MATPKEEAEELLRLAKEEARIREEMNSSYDNYIEAVKKAHKLQETLNHSTKVEAETNQKIADLKARIRSMSAGPLKTALQNEVDIEEEKLKIIEKQNKLLGKQIELYKAAAKEANFGWMAAGKAFAGLTKMSQGFFSSIKSGWGQIKGFGLFEFDKAIKQSALSMGILSKESDGFRSNLKAAAKETTMMGVNLKALAELQSAYSERLGRTVELSKEGLKGMAAMSKMTGLGAEGAAQMAADMDLQGYSAERTADFVDQTLDSSHKMGVNATKVMKNLGANFKLMNSYHFKEGAKGLAKLAQLTTKLGVDMSSVSTMADKLWNIEGAVEMSAQLNVMGGAWAKMADPFHLAYMARNDMKGLTEEIAKASQESVFFNNVTKEFDMTAEGMHRLKIIAEQTGAKYEDLVTMGKNMAKFDKIKSEIGFSVNTTDEKDKQMLEYLSSKSYLDAKGDAVIMLKGEPKLVKTLNASDRALIDAQILQQQDMEERAKQARTFDEQLTYMIDQLKVYFLPLVETINDRLLPKIDDFVKKFDGEWGKTIEEFAKSIGGMISTFAEFIIENPKLVAGLWAFSKVAPILVGAFKLFGGIYDTIKWFKNGIALSQGFLTGTGGGGGVPGGGGAPGGGPAGGGGFGAKLFGQKPGGGWGNLKGGLKSAGGIGAGLLAAGIAGYSEYSENAELGMSTGENVGRTGAKASGAGLGAWGGAAAGAALGTLLLPGIGTLIGGAIGGLAGGYFGGETGEAIGDGIWGEETDDAIFSSPVKDASFSGAQTKMKKNIVSTAVGTIKSSNSKAMVRPRAKGDSTVDKILNTRGIVQGGKITPIDNRDDIDLIANKPGGAISNYAGNSTNGTIKHDFGNINISGSITINAPGGAITENIANDESIRREITRAVREGVIKELNMNKTKGEIV